MWSGSNRGRDASQDLTLGFVIEGERRVIAHCERLMAAGGLAVDDRDRLLRLRNEAEARLGRLTFADAA